MKCPFCQKSQTRVVDSSFKCLSKVRLREGVRVISVKQGFPRMGKPLIECKPKVIKSAICTKKVFVSAN